ncbi:MAG: PspC domain-containing protein [bacterium]|nr:PspC domain-containing protein [bacterium]
MKRLYKSKKDKMAFGVCSGIAKYFDLDPVLVRVLFVIFFFLGGSALIAYIVGAIIMPDNPLETGNATEAPPRPEQEPAQVVPASKNSGSMGALIFGIILVGLGAYFMMEKIPFLHGLHWWFRWNFFDYALPAILILAGGAILVRRNNNEKGTEDSNESLTSVE